MTMTRPLFFGNWRTHALFLDQFHRARATAGIHFLRNNNLIRSSVEVAAGDNL